MNKIPGIGWLATKLVAGVTGPFKWIAGIFLEILFNWLATKGVYFIDTTVNGIRTNMGGEKFKKLMGDGWEQVESGVDPKKGKAIDEGVKRAFSKFVVFRVRK